MGGWEKKISHGYIQGLSVRYTSLMHQHNSNFLWCYWLTWGVISSRGRGLWPIWQSTTRRGLRHPPLHTVNDFFKNNKCTLYCCISLWFPLIKNVLKSPGSGITSRQSYHFTDQTGRSSCSSSRLPGRSLMCQRQNRTKRATVFPHECRLQRCSYNSFVPFFYNCYFVHVIEVIYKIQGYKL